MHLSGHLPDNHHITVLNANVHKYLVINVHVAGTSTELDAYVVHRLVFFQPDMN